MTSAVELGVTPSDALIWGTAVTTIVPSRISMKKHAATRRATLRRRSSIIERAAKHAGDTAAMTFIETVPEGDASGELTQMYEADRETFGHVPNLTRAFSHRPDVYAAWRQLNGAIKANMDLRRYELATVAAARRLRSSYCTLAHGSVLMDKFVAPDELAAIVSDHHAAGLEPVDVAVMDLADKVAQDATSVTQADVDRPAHARALRRRGLRRDRGGRGALLLQQGARRRRRAARRQVRRPGRAAARDADRGTADRRPMIARSGALRSRQS